MMTAPTATARAVSHPTPPTSARNFQVATIASATTAEKDGDEDLLSTGPAAAAQRGRQPRRAQAEQQGKQRAAQHDLRNGAGANVKIAVKQRRDDREPIGTKIMLRTSTIEVQIQRFGCLHAAGRHPLHPRGGADPDRQHRDQQSAADDRRHGHHPDQEDRPQRDEDQDREQVASSSRGAAATAC